MRIAFLTSSCEDYLSDALLHGLRGLLGADVVDFPKAERMYQNCLPATRSQIRGRAFTLYGLLDDIEIDRHDIYWKISRRHFDLVIVGDIFRDYGAFVQLLPYLEPGRVAIVDGADSPAPYPYAGKWWRSPRMWFLPRANRFPYFKRELTPRTLHYRTFKMVPECLCGLLRKPSNWHPIAFAIPDQKVLAEGPKKDKLFTQQIVDPEVALCVRKSSCSSMFESEADYYADLRQSRFGITKRRSGWDCLRHYELAANGCVPCFRDLDRKPASCAPHGMDSSNCVVYHNYQELAMRVEGLTETQYGELQRGALKWAGENTTSVRAKSLLDQFMPVISGRRSM